MTYRNNNVLRNQLHLVNIEPYTSDMYDALLQPSMQIMEKNYIQYQRRPFSREIFMRSLLIAPISGAAIGVSRTIFSIAYHNIYNDFKSAPEPKPPIDIFFLNYYTDFHKYPQMLRGLKTELKIECTYQAYKNVLMTSSKYLIHPKGENFAANFGFTFARSFISNAISAMTIYPLMLAKFTDKDPEEIVHKVVHRAGTKSLIAGIIAGGISIARATMPSYKKMLSFAQYMIVG